MAFDETRNSNECASILKNALKDLADLKKREKALADAMVTHETIQHKHNALVAGYAEDIGEAVQEAKDEDHPGKVIGDFKDVPEVKGHLSALAKFLKGDAEVREKAVKKLTAEAREVLEAYDSIQETLEKELDEQAKFVKEKKIKAPESVAKISAKLKEFKELVKEAQALLEEFLAIDDYADKLEKKANRLIGLEVAKTKQDRKAAASAAFSKMVFDLRRLKKNVGIAETLLDAIEEAFAQASANALGRSPANMQEVIKKAKADAEAADGKLQKINAIHVAEYLKLSKHEKDSLPMTPEGKKALANIARIEQAAAEGSALMKQIFKL